MKLLKLSPYKEVMCVSTDSAGLLTAEKWIEYVVEALTISERFFF